MKKWMYFFLVGMFLTCNIPTDAHKSWDQAREHGLKVGVIDNPPYAHKTETGVSGTEIELIKQFAARHQLDIQFYQANESQLFTELEAYHYTLVLGGIEKKTPWKSKVALTKPYDTQHVFAIPKGENEVLYKLESYINKHTP